LLLKSGSERGQAVAVRGGVIAMSGLATRSVRATRICRRMIFLACRHAGLYRRASSFDAELRQGAGVRRAVGDFPAHLGAARSVARWRAVYLSSKLAALEALRGGFTTVVDAGTRAEADVASVARATKEAGCVACSASSATTSAPLAAAAIARRFCKRPRLIWPAGSQRRSRSSVAGDFDSGSRDRRDAACRLAAAAEAGAIFQTHVNEHLVAVERSLVERRLRPLEHLAAAKALGPQTLIAHSTLVTPPELMLLARTDTAVAYNPVASTWKGNAVAPQK
jgi:cytosine/adenosine deaminase-related metal-dependent hydrolase